MAMFLAVGSCVETANELEDVLIDKGYNPTIVNARFIKPIDEELINQLAEEHELIVTIEENVLNGGYGMNVLSYVNNNNIDVKVLTKALPDSYIEHGDSRELKKIYGLNALDISKDIIKRIDK